MLPNQTMHGVYLEVLERGVLARYLRVVDVEQSLPGEMLTAMPAMIAHAAKQLGVAPELEPYQEEPAAQPFVAPPMPPRKAVRAHAVFCATDEDVLKAVREAREQIALIEKLGLSFHG